MASATTVSAPMPPFVTPVRSTRGCQRMARLNALENSHVFPFTRSVKALTTSTPSVLNLTSVDILFGSGGGPGIRERWIHPVIYTPHRPQQVFIQTHSLTVACININYPCIANQDVRM